MSAQELISNREELMQWRDKCRAQGLSVILTNGCFDLVHVGHLRCLEYARGLGDCLVVAINSDLSVKELKGDSRPLVEEMDRAELIAGLECVDRVVIFSEKRLTSMVEWLEPDVYAKGGDYDLKTMDQGERTALEACGCKIEFFEVIEGRSTTRLFEKMASLV